MNQVKQAYESADEWRNAAMSRSGTVDQQESEMRQKSAALHNQQNNISDPDVVLDQQLYILGKMEIDEYQNYLLFKHSRSG